MKGIASKLVKHILKEAKNNRCYKAILNCSDDNMGFYEKLGFYKNENEMRINIG